MSFLKTPVKLANVPGSVETTREIYRECVNQIKGLEKIRFENWTGSDSVPAFIHYDTFRSRWLAIAIFPQREPARYFLYPTRIPAPLRKLIARWEKRAGITPKLDPGLAPTPSSTAHPAKGGNYVRSSANSKTVFRLARDTIRRRRERSDRLRGN